MSVYLSLKLKRVLVALVVLAVSPCGRFPFS